MSLLHERRKTRWLAYQITYQNHYLMTTPKTICYLLNKKIKHPENVVTCNKILQLVRDNHKHVQSLMARNLIGWKTMRIEPLLNAVLSVAIVELYYLKTVNPKIIISEAVAFLNNYATKKSANIANGLLQNIWHKECGDNFVINTNN